jgi:conjugative transfer relaxase protein TraI
MERPTDLIRGAFMLSVQPLKSAQGAADYYAAAFNYYAGDAMAMRWLGKGSERLGLTGMVEKEQMLALLQGILPDGTLLQNKKGEHRPGFDMTFSAPKSVSILVGLQADPKLEALHDQAVEKAIGLIEKEFGQARVVIDGKVHYVDTGNLVVAAFRQPSSRANDPALHTHGVTMNMTFTDEDGKARSLASDIHGHAGVVEQLQQHITYAGLLYRTEYANLLKEEGYRLRDVGKGMFEIVGIPEEVMKEFSSRRTDIEAKMKEKGWEGARRASQATLLTRNVKEEHDITVLRADWEKRAEGLGFNAETFIKNHKDAYQKDTAPSFFGSLKEKVFDRFFEKDDLVALKAKEAVSVAIETISQKTSVFEKRELKEAALKHTLAGKTIVSIEAIERSIEQSIKDHAMYQASDPVTNRPMLTTPWALTMETETLSRIDANKDVLQPIANLHAVMKHSKQHEEDSGFSMTPSQKNALLHVFTTTDRFNAVQGYAGSGKTTMLKTTVQLAVEKGFDVRGIAVTSSAVNELTDKAGICSKAFPSAHHALIRAADNSLQKTIFMLDEASMLSTSQGHEIVKLIEKKGARLFLIGDDDQLASVKCGRIFGQSQEYGIQTTRMTDLTRYSNEQMKGSVVSVINRELYESVNKLDEVRELNTHDERIEALANRWLSLSHSVRDRTLVFAPTHANRHDITSIMRDGLKKEGGLVGQEIVLDTLKSKEMEEIQLHHAQYYQSGDVLRFNIHIPQSRIKPGDYLTIGDITEKHQRKKTIPLVPSEGKAVLMHLEDLPKYKQTRAGLNRPIEFYEKTSLELCAQDKVLVTRNNNKSGLVNSSLASIKSIQENELTLCFEKDGGEKTFPLDANELKHLDHGYVLTNMKVQGKDKEYALGLIESYSKFSATLRNYYVQISRAISSMTLFTDDKTRLLKALEMNDDTKKTALDYISSDTVKKHVARFEGNPHAIPVTDVMDKQRQREQEVSRKQTLVQEYSDAKEQGKTALSSYLAYHIVQDETTKKIAQHNLDASETVIRNDALKFETVKLLKTLTKDERDKALVVKRYLESCHQTQKTWKSVHDGNNATLQKSHAFNEGIKRNALAHQITESIEAYKPYLKHFSIGQINRLGVSQYRIEKGEERAVKRLENLSVHAEKHQLSLKISSFFNEKNTEKKEQLAVELKNQSKVVHPYLIQRSEAENKDLNLLWRDINEHARIGEEKMFVSELSEREEPLFNLIKSYKTFNRELAIQTVEAIYLAEKGFEVPQSFEKKRTALSSLRNEIASKASNNPAFDKITNFFKLDKAKLGHQDKLHEKRETVLAFKQNKSNFEQKKEDALKIAGDIKGHYPFIKSLNVNTNALNALVRIEARKAFTEGLNDAQKEDYWRVVDYRMKCSKASSAWKDVFSDKEGGIKPSKEKLMLAKQLTASRNKLACFLEGVHGVQPMLGQEKLDTLKMNMHARQHEDKLNTAFVLNQTKEKLLNQLSTRMPKMNKPEAHAWRQSWNEFNHDLKRIAFNRELYQEAINDLKQSPFDLTENQKSMLGKVDLEVPRHSKKAANVQTATKSHRIFKESKSLVNHHAQSQKTFLDASVITHALLDNPMESYRAIFGEPKKVSSKEMRYEGGLVVSLKGSKAGFWYNFSEGEGGSPIQAIMRERNISFQEALKEGAAIAGIAETSTFAAMPKKRQKQVIHNKQEEKNKITSAKSIVKGGVSIKGTLAERYLKEHRNIEDPSRLNVLFWPKGSTWKATDDNGDLYEKNNKIPALLIPAKNDKGEITGVQRIYLDGKTGGKNTFMDTAKLSKGKIESSAGIIQKGEKLGTLYLAEGPETAATLAMANPKSTVLVSFGLSNLKNLSRIIKNHYPTEVIIAGDNDSLSKNNTFDTTKHAQELLKKEGVVSKIIIPKAINGQEKTDWNDVHKTEGLLLVQKKLGLVNDTVVLHELHKNLSKEKDYDLKESIDNFSKEVTNTNKNLHKSIPGEDELISTYNRINETNQADSKSIESIQSNEKVREKVIFDLEI